MVGKELINNPSDTKNYFAALKLKYKSFLSNSKLFEKDGAFLVWLCSDMANDICFSLVSIWEIINVC